MNRTALILDWVTLYWYSIVLALAAAAGICFFLACCSHARIEPVWAGASALLSVVFSLVLSRLVYWYCRPYSFADWKQALTVPASVCHALLGAFIGCLLAALLLGKCSGGLLRLLDCMSTAGCGAIALGRLAFFFADGDRGRILPETTPFPWAYPIVNPSSGIPEYRLAVFFFQAVIAGALFLVLAWLLFAPRAGRRVKRGGITLLFLMVYSASQVILDSTRYDSLYLRSNGFVSLIQIISALTLAGTIAVCSLRAAKGGVKKWMLAAWFLIPCLFGGAGYMEYFVQRHGKLAAIGYGAMSGCLAGILLLGVLLWRKAQGERSAG